MVLFDSGYCSSELFKKETGVLSFLREAATVDEVSGFLVCSYQSLLQHSACCPSLATCTMYIAVV